MHNPPPPQDVILAARALAETVRQRAPLTEAHRSPLDATLAEFRGAGFYRMCVPIAYGGWGMDVETAIRVAFELARGCASSGWIVAQIAFEGIMASAFPQEAQDAFWHGAPDTGAVSANAIVESEVAAVEGGFRVSGRWKWASGADQAAWLILTQPARGMTEMMLIPRQDFAIVDDWFTMGLAGTGSKQIVVRDALVPACRTAPLANVKSFGMSIWILGGIAWGAAQGAYEAFEHVMTTRRSSKDLSRPADREGVQIALAESAVELECCRMLFEGNVALHRQAVAESRELSPQEVLLVSRDCSYAARAAYRSTLRLFDEFGASVIYDDNPIQLALRDIMAATRHPRIAWHLNARKYGMSRLGL